jgi:O-antigen ligase
LTAIDVVQQLRQSGKARTGSAGETSTSSLIAKTTPKSSTPAYVIWTAILIALMVGKVSDWVPGLSSIPLVKIAYLFAAISAYVGAGAALAPVRIRSSKITRAALAFLGLAIVSFVFSIYKSATVSISLFIMIIILTIMLVLRVTQTLGDVEKLILGFAAAGVSLSAGLVLNYHGGRAFINGNFDPNDIAYSLDTILPLVLSLRQRQSRLGSLLMNAFAVVTVLAILLTGSRGGAVGLCVVMAAATAFPLGRDSHGALKKFSIRRTLIRCAILVLAVAFAWGYLPADTQQRMATLVNLSNDYNADSTENGSRLLIWKQDIGMVWKRPIGYGLGSAELVDGLAGGQYRTAHNSFVEALVELGVLGLLIYLRVLYTTWRELGRVIMVARDPAAGEEVQKAALYSRALRTALAGNLAAGFFLSQAYSAGLWMLVAIAASLVRVSIPTTRANTSVGSTPAATQVLDASERN